MTAAQMTTLVSGFDFAISITPFWSIARRPIKPRIAGARKEKGQAPWGLGCVDGVSLYSVGVGSECTCDDTVQSRVGREPAFASALLQEAAQSMLCGDVATARNLVRNVIKGSIGYTKLSKGIGTPKTSLIRMFGRTGNLTAENFSAVFVHLQRVGGVRLRVSAEPVPPPRQHPARRSSHPQRAA